MGPDTETQNSSRQYMNIWRFMFECRTTCRIRLSVRWHAPGCWCWCCCWCWCGCRGERAGRTCESVQWTQKIGNKTWWIHADLTQKSKAIFSQASHCVFSFLKPVISVRPARAETQHYFIRPAVEGEVSFIFPSKVWMFLRFCSRPDYWNRLNSGRIKWWRRKMRINSCFTDPLFCRCEGSWAQWNKKVGISPTWCRENVICRHSGGYLSHMLPVLSRWSYVHSMFCSYRISSSQLFHLERL